MKYLFLFSLLSLFSPSFASSGNKIKIQSLISNLKSSSLSESQRWQAGMGLVKLMGKKSIPLMTKLLNHPNWSTRIMAIKSIRLLKDQSKVKLIEQRLFDKSALVRVEALETLRSWKSRSSGKMIWKMLFDKKNYFTKKKKNSLNIQMASKIISAIGDIGYIKAKQNLKSLFNKNQFKSVNHVIKESYNKL